MILLRDQSRYYIEHSTVVMIIGATNHVDKLDKAVVDRIGSCITFNALDASTRKHILQRELEHNQTCLSDDDWMAVGQLTAGMTGRGIVSLCSDVALTSVYKAQAGITFDTFRDSLRPVTSTTTLHPAPRDGSPPTQRHQWRRGGEWCRRHRGGEWCRRQYCGAPPCLANIPANIYLPLDQPFDRLAGIAVSRTWPYD